MLTNKNCFRALVMAAAATAAGCSGESSDESSDETSDETSDESSDESSDETSDETGRCMAITESIPPVCSLDGTERRTVSFTNNCSEEIDVWWVTYGCLERFTQRLAPGGSFTESSFVTHPWRARAVPATGEPGATKGALLKEFGTIPPGMDDLYLAVP